VSLTPEFRAIEILQARCSSGAPDVQLGIGDDAAITTPPAGHELVTATDALVVGTHFVENAAPQSVGHRAIAANLSDIAAMGASPRWATLALSMPEFDALWVAGFAEGFASLANEHGVTLIGGDTVRGGLSACVTLMGNVPAGCAVRRSGARVGDSVFVSGRPGWAGAGCAIRLGSLASVNADRYLQAFEFPEPRVAWGLAVREIASAMIDVSDGVFTDLGRLLDASGKGADCEMPDLTDLTHDFGRQKARELFFAGGEDYELCFTVAPEHQAKVYALSQATELPVTLLGTVTELSGMRWSQAGERVEPPAAVFEHFQER